MEKEPQLIIKPRVVVPVVATVLGWTIIIEAILLTVEYALPEYAAWVIDPGMRGFFAALIILIGLVQYLSLHKLEYRIFKDRLEYQEFFLTQTVSSIPMKRVTNMTMRRDWFMDRIFDTGTIIVFTESLDRGIEIGFVREPKATFAKFLEIQSAATPLGPEKELVALKD